MTHGYFFSGKPKKVSGKFPGKARTKGITAESDFREFAENFQEISHEFPGDLPGAEILPPRGRRQVSGA